MSENEKLVALLRRVYEKTQNGELRWEQTANPNAFTVSFARFSLSLERIPETEDVAELILLRISNDQGRTVEELYGNQARRIGFEDMHDLFDRARRIAMGFDEALDELLVELDESSQRKS